MNKYKVISTYTVQYDEIIEAASKQEAEKMYDDQITNDATNAAEIWNRAKLSIDDITEA